MFKKWKFWGGGGLCEIPSVVGVWIFSGTTQCYFFRGIGNKLLSWISLQAVKKPAVSSTESTKSHLPANFNREK